MGQRISQLDLAGPLGGTEYIAIVKDGRTKRTTIDNLAPLFTGSCQCTLVSRWDSVGTDANTLKKHLQTWQYPGGTLNTNGSRLEVIAFGTLASGSSTRIIEIEFGAINTNFVCGLDVAEVNWRLESTIIRKSSILQMMSSKFIISNGSYNTGKTAHTINSGNNNILADVPFYISGQSNIGNSNDITIDALIIDLHQMDPNS